MNLKVKTAVAAALDKSGIISAIKSYRSSRGGVVLALHRVLPADQAKESFEPSITITDSVLEQLLMLLHREYRVVSLQQLMEQPEDLDHRQRVAITFDDGWADTYSHAYPLLLRYGMPATVFLCPGLMSEGQVLPEERIARIWRWCLEERHLQFLLRDLRKWGLNGGESHVRHVWARQVKKLALNAKLLMLNHLEDTYGVPRCTERRFLSWDEVKIMRRNNITFGSHTMNHATLTAERYPSLDEELKRSREVIEFRLQEETSWLAYPNGAYDRRIMEAARRAGYSYCFTTEQRNVNRKVDPYAAPRVGIDDASLVSNMFELHPSRTRLHLQRLVGQS